MSGRYTSPYRSVGNTGVRKDYHSSVRRDNFSPQRGSRGYTGGDASSTVATNVVYEMIDHAVRSPVSPPRANYQPSSAVGPYHRPIDIRNCRSRSVSPVRTTGREYSRRPASAYLGCRSSSVSPVRTAGRDYPRRPASTYLGRRSPSVSPVRTREISRRPASAYRTRDPSPQYNRDNGSYSSNLYRDEKDEKRGYDSERNRRVYDDNRHSRASRSYAGGRSEYDDSGSRYGKEYNDGRSSKGIASEPFRRTPPSRAEYKNTGFRKEYDERESMRRDFDRREDISRYSGSDYEDRSRVEDRDCDGTRRFHGGRNNEDRDRIGGKHFDDRRYSGRQRL